MPRLQADLLAACKRALAFGEGHPDRTVGWHDERLATQGVLRRAIELAEKPAVPPSIRAAIRFAITDWLADDMEGGVDALAETILGIPGSDGSWTGLEAAAEAAVHMIDLLARDEGPPKDADACMAEVRAAIVAQIGEIKNRQD